MELNEEILKKIATTVSADVANLVAQKMVEQAKGQRDSLAALFAEQQKQKAAPGIGLARVLLAYAACGGSKAVPDKAKMLEAAKAFGFNDQEKAIQESVFANGGALIQPEYTGELIGLLRPMNVLEQLGASFRPFRTEVILGRLGGGTTAYWLAEGEAVTKSQPVFEQIKLKKHKLGIAVDISKDILRNPDAAAAHESIVRSDMVEAAKVELEKKGIVGIGGEKSPKGILNLMDATQKVARTGTGTATDQITDTDKLPRIIKQTERSEQKRGWLFDPIEEAKLLSLRDTAGWVFRDEMMLKNTLRGAPYKTHTAVTAGVRIYGEWSDLEYGISQEAVIEQSDGLRFLNDEVTVLLVMGGDFQTRRPKSFAATTGN
jgi:HK97 family phage major capsid protein